MPFRGFRNIINKCRWAGEKASPPPCTLRTSLYALIFGIVFKNHLLSGEREERVRRSVLGQKRWKTSSLGEKRLKTSIFDQKGENIDYGKKVKNIDFWSKKGGKHRFWVKKWKTSILSQKRENIDFGSTWV